MVYGDYCWMYGDVFGGVDCCVGDWFVVFFVGFFEVVDLCYDCIGDVVGYFVYYCVVGLFGDFG